MSACRHGVLTGVAADFSCVPINDHCIRLYFKSYIYVYRVCGSFSPPLPTGSCSLLDTNTCALLVTVRQTGVSSALTRHRADDL